MKLKKGLLVTSMSFALLAFVSTNQSFAGEPKAQILNPIKTIQLTSFPKFNLMTPDQINDLALKNISLKLGGVTCKFEMGIGCKVTNSNNNFIKSGSILNSYFIPKSSKYFRPTAYGMKCSWCGFAADVIAVTAGVVGVVGGPVTAVVLFAYATPTAIILSHV